MNKLKQLYLLMWKNAKLQRRRPVGTLVQIGLPFFISLVFLLLRISLIKAEKHDAITWPKYRITSPPATLKKSFMIGYASAPGLNISEDFVNNITHFINEKTYPNQEIKFHYFESEDRMVNYLVETGNKSFIGGVYFSSISEHLLGNFEYAIRLTSNPNTSKNSANQFTSAGREWVTRFVFPKFQLPQPRNKNDSYGANPSYYKEGFLLIQYAIDRAIVHLSGKGNVTVFMQKYPFPNYVKDDFIIIIQNFFPDVLVIAFIYSALCIVRSIVYEKEKRLKVRKLER